jgi:hypothetical protein
MLDEEAFLKRRRARRWDVRSAAATVLCSLVLVYLTAAAIVGILAS